jgi:DNA-binding transcriptional MerR regulator
MDKSPQAFRTISEVSEALDIPAHVLRFWESRFPQLRPTKSSGGRRYYRPEDVELLRGIRELLYDDGLTIKGVQKVFREQGAKAIVERGLAAGGETAPRAPGAAVAAPAQDLWDNADVDALVEPALPADALRRARVADAIARLEAVRARILRSVDG